MAVSSVPISWSEPVACPPSASEKEPSAVREEPSAVREEPSAVREEPSAVREEPSASEREPPQPASPLPTQQCRRSPPAEQCRLECFESLDEDDDEIELPTNMFIEDHKYEDSVMSWVMESLDPLHGMGDAFVDIHTPIDCATLFAYDPWKTNVHTNVMFMCHILRVAGLAAPTIAAYMQGIVGDDKTVAAHAAMVRAHFMQGNKLVLHTWVAHYTR